MKSHPSFAVTLLLGLLTTATGAIASLTDEDQQLRQNATRLLQEIGFIKTANTLNLTREQMQSLLTLSNEAHRIADRESPEWDKIQREQKEAFTAFREEDMKDILFSQPVESRTKQADQRGKDLLKSFAERINGLEDRAKSVLTADQLRQLESIKSPQDAKKLFKPEKARGRQADGTEDELTQVKQDLLQIHHEKHGSVGTIGRFLLAPNAPAVLRKQLGLPAEPAATRTGLTIGQVDDTVQDLRSDINLLNLINGLHLTPEQMARLRDAAREVEAAQGPAKPSFDSAKARTLIPQLEKARNEVAAGKPVPLALLKQAKDLVKPGASGKRTNFVSGEKPLELAAEVERALSDAQKVVIGDYKACLIPTKNLRDPVRVGQASDSSAGINKLGELRKIPAERFARDQEALVERTLKGVEKHAGCYEGAEREAKKEWLSKFLVEVRAMSDVDFELNKKDLGEKLQTLNKEEELRKRLEELSGGKQNAIRHKIAGFLLSPRIVPLLEARLAQPKDMAAGGN